MCMRKSKPLLQSGESGLVQGGGAAGVEVDASTASIRSSLVVPGILGRLSAWKQDI